MTEGVHIVVVDDEDDIRETFQEYLSNHGYRVTALSSGKELRALVDVEEPIDIAIPAW